MSDSKATFDTVFHTLINTHNRLQARWEKSFVANDGKSERISAAATKIAKRLDSIMDAHMGNRCWSCGAPVGNTESDCWNCEAGLK